MKKLVVITMSIFAACVFAAEASTTKAKPRKLTPEMKAKLMARTGGTVVLRAEGPEFVFMNAQKVVQTANLEKVPKELEKVLNFPFSIQDVMVSGNTIGEVGKLFNFKTAAIILIVDDANIPTSTLVALESKWAIINVAALNVDKPDAEKLASRVRKEMWRMFAVLMGASNNQRYGCLMKSVHSLADLDALPYETVSPDPFMHVCRTMDKLGMKRNKAATYRKAYIEGWAPPPQTDMQRKIVEEENARGNGPKK